MTEQTAPSTELVRQNSTSYARAPLSERHRYVALLAQAGDLLPANLQGMPVRDPNTGQMVRQANLGKTFLLCETGDMLGIHPMAAITGVHIIDGKPSISANLMSGLVRTAGHRLRVTVAGKVEDGTASARAELTRSDDPDFTFVVEWTIEDAKRAGLFPGKPNSNWQKYPKAMLKARAVSEIVREGAADVLMGGNVYTPEELGAEVNEAGEPINLPQVPNPSQPGTPEPQPQAQPQQPRQEAPIADEPPTDGPDPIGEEWMKIIRDLSKAGTTSTQVREAYRKGQQEGTLATKVKQGRETREVGQILIDMGTALAEAEKVQEEVEREAAAEVSDDDEVVVAEVVDEGGDS